MQLELFEIGHEQEQEQVLLSRINEGFIYGVTMLVLVYETLLMPDSLTRKQTMRHIQLNIYRMCCFESFFTTDLRMKYVVLKQ